LTELSEFIHYRQSSQMPVSAELLAIRESWQAISQKKIGPSLSRALQVAQGEAMAEPSMNLAQWLDADAAEVSAIAPERLMVATQFSWLRDSLVFDRGESSESTTPSERAQRIIELAQAYQSSPQASADAGEALWQLGSFMAVVGYEGEAWDCLGQAAAIYSELAQDLLTEFADPQGRSEQAEQRYYAYRAAALAATGEAVSLATDAPAAKKCSAMLAAEILAKFSQLRRAWSGSSDSPEPPRILSTSGNALRFVHELSQAKAYGRARMRFWWWYYPPELAAGPQRTDRPKLEYIESKTPPGT